MRDPEHTWRDLAPRRRPDENPHPPGKAMLSNLPEWGSSEARVHAPVLSRPQCLVGLPPGLGNWHTEAERFQLQGALCRLPRAATANHHKLRGVNQHKSILPPLLETRNLKSRCAQGLAPCRDSREGSCLSLSSFGGLLAIAGVLSLVAASRQGPHLSLHVLLPACPRGPLRLAFLCLLSPYKDTSH